MRTWLWAILLFLALLAFYTVTLQPSLAWGDGIRLQREVITAESFILAEIVNVDFAPDPWPFARLGVAAWDHPLYVMLGHILVRSLPIAHAPWLVNFISAIFGAGAIVLFFMLCTRHTRSLSAALLASLALALSHTFWWHAVTPEVYTLFAFLLLLAVYSFDTYEQNGRFRALLLASLAMGLGVANHLLAGLALPALILYLLISRNARRALRLSWQQWLWLILVFIIGFIPYWVQFLRLLRTFALPELFGTALGSTFLQGSTALSLSQLAQSTTSYLTFLVYNFLPIGLLLGIYGWWVGRDAYPVLWKKSASLFTVYLLFGLFYSVSDQFAFFLGAHIFWAAALAMGIAQLQMKLWPDRRWILNTVLAVAFLITPLFYHVTPDALRAAGLSEETFGVPQIGTGVRDGLTYYLDPNKNGDLSADAFGLQTMANLPADSLVLAEWYADTDEYFVLRYLAVVDGLRPDVDLAGWPTENPFAFDSQLALDLVAQELPQRPVYLASLDEEFYATSTLMAQYCIVEEYNLYRVYSQSEAEGQSCLAP